VDSLQLLEISQAYYQNYIQNIALHRIVSNTRAVCFALDEKKNFLKGTYLSKGAILPFFEVKR